MASQSVITLQHAHGPDICCPLHLPFTSTILPIFYDSVLFQPLFQHASRRHRCFRFSYFLLFHYISLALWIATFDLGSILDVCRVHPE